MVVPWCASQFRRRAVSSYGDNKMIIDSSTSPHTKLHKSHSTLSFHCAHKAIASSNHCCASHTGSESESHSWRAQSCQYPELALAGAARRSGKSHSPSCSSRHRETQLLSTWMTVPRTSCLPNSYKQFEACAVHMFVSSCHPRILDWWRVTEFTQLCNTHEPWSKSS